MFHSLFNVLAFGNYPNTFGVALQRRKFPTNVWVHIHKSERLILCILILLLRNCVLCYHTCTERTGYRPDSEWLRCTRRGFLLPCHSSNG